MFNSRLLVYQRVHISSSGWWCNNHLEQYEFVNGKDYIPYMKWKVKHVWNHHPVIYLILLFITLKTSHYSSITTTEKSANGDKRMDHGLIMDWSWIDGERSCKTMQTYMKDWSNDHDSQWCTKGSKGVCTAWLAPNQSMCEPSTWTFTRNHPYTHRDGFVVVCLHMA